jgi:hypothetical protein
MDPLRNEPRLQAIERQGEFWAAAGSDHACKNGR